MKFHPSNLFQVTLVSLVLFLSFSCNKDSDLLAEYVVENPKAFLVNDIVITLANRPIKIEPLKNDTFKEPEKVIITEVTPPKIGIAIVNEDNTITYTPDTDKTGTDEFDYSASITNSDKSVTTETGKVTVTVTEEENNTTPPSDFGELKAFPSAYGAGAYTTGGRGGKVFIVSNLNNSGTGSFREAAEAQEARTIVFAVSGTIELTSTLNVNHGDLTIAGQTAPDGGITLTGSWVRFYNADNVIIRYIRIRPDYNTSTEGDAINFLNCSDVIMDHVSVSWGSDEVLSVTGDADRITLQRTLIAEGKTGSILGDSDNPGLSDNLSIHTSLYYNITHRFPNLNTTTRGDILNNVIFNWKYRLSTNMGGQKLNHINNYYSQGCLTEWDSNGARMRLDFKGSIPSIYTSGNLVMPTLQTSINSKNWNMWQFFVDSNYNGISLAGRSPLPTTFESNSPFPFLGSPLPILTAQNAFNDVTNDVGANKRLDEFGNIQKSQDDIDALFLSNVINGECVNYESGSNASYHKTPYYITFQNKVSNKPIASHNDKYDTDKDGMPDAWEIAKFGDISKTPNGDENNNGYTNIEEYISLID